MINKVLLFTDIFVMHEEGTMSPWGGAGGKKWDNELEDNVLFI